MLFSVPFDQLPGAIDQVTKDLATGRAYAVKFRQRIDGVASVNPDESALVASRQAGVAIAKDGKPVLLLSSDRPQWSSCPVAKTLEKLLGIQFVEETSDNRAVSDVLRPGTLKPYNGCSYVETERISSWDGGYLVCHGLTPYD